MLNAQSHVNRAYIFMQNLKCISCIVYPCSPFFLLLTDRETKRSTNLRRKRGKRREENSRKPKTISNYFWCFGISKTTKRLTHRKTRLYNRADLYSSCKMGHFTRHSCLLALILCLVFNTQVSQQHQILGGVGKEESVVVNFVCRNADDVR